MSIPTKSRTKGELLSYVIFEFVNWANLWLSKDQYLSYGGYRGVIKSLEIPVGEIKKVHHLIVNPKDVPTNDWEP